MREPQIEKEVGTDAFVPFSHAPISVLRMVAAGAFEPWPCDHDGMMPDMDFHQRYAAIVLRNAAYRKRPQDDERAEIFSNGGSGKDEYR